MKYSWLFLLSISLSAGFGLESLADGLAYKGHVIGPHTDLTLTEEQASHLQSGQKTIVLTAEQKKLLGKLPQSAAVESLYIFPAETEICTCELSNVAVQVSANKIEVADSLLGRDLSREDQIRESFLKAEEDKRYAAQHIHRGSKELLLFDKARKSENDNDLETAVSLYEQAIEINPAFRDAKHNLSFAASNLGIAKLEKGQAQDAISFFEKSLKLARELKDISLVKEEQRNIKKARQELKKKK